ncbi:universal stress protein [Serratia quinivorans]|jgi:nucleotide-binding universal stress UspA family protein|uniref:universal stress protein n=1 Tax=Serratia TaxID=613 RepID=UPI00217C355F|nr:universal stress protein [Serratia quinivorans]CAI1113270.1 Universal stress protein A [Serratia quinivorans]CAI1953353.1 Universal stress protein A [Serratia quinivorans]
MLYKNILVALDLKDNNKKLLDRALSLSSATQAKLYVVHVGVDVGELYSGVVINHLDNFQTRVINDDVSLLKQFLNDGGYDTSPIVEALEVVGDFNREIEKILFDKHIELLICGHRHNFLSRLMPTSRHLINNAKTDVLLVSLPEQTDS